MRVVYVAGPYRSSAGAWGVRDNIDVATRAAREIWLMGLAVICPHANTAWMDGPQNSTNEHGAACGSGDEVFLRGDLEILTRCDALVLVGEWRKSAGTKAERELAMGIMPVFEWPRDRARLERFAVAQEQPNLLGQADPREVLLSLTEANVQCGCGHKRGIHGVTPRDTRCAGASCDCAAFRVASNVKAL